MLKQLDKLNEIQKNLKEYKDEKLWTKVQIKYMWKKSNQYSQQNQKLKKMGLFTNYKSICTQAKQNKKDTISTKKKPYHKKKKVNPTENT